MIKDIQELNFPKLEGQEKSYATMSAATVSQPDMGEWNITSQIKIDGDIAPDFSFDWEVVHDGHKYIMPLRNPQGSKENTTLNSVIDLTFQHWAVYQLKRYWFFEYISVGSGIVSPDKWEASLSLNLGTFCIAFSQVLSYWFGDKITIDLNPQWQYSQEPVVINISYSYIWDVLIKFYELFGVRWVIKPNGGYDKYVIKVGYPTTEQSHIFEYGFEGGLLKVERQVQNPDIRNMIYGRGGEKNLPKYYFKEAPADSLSPSDPDAIPELANIYFSELRGATFRSYVQGWKARHYGGSTTAAQAYAPWAWYRGYTDSKFDPVEYVKDDESIMRYGEMLGGLNRNDDIYPTKRIAAVDVEQIESDDVVQSIESDAEQTNVSGGQTKVTKTLSGYERATLIIQGGSFTVPENKEANFDEGPKTIRLTKDGKNVTATTDSGEVEIDGDLIVIESVSVGIRNLYTGATLSGSGIPGGRYTFTISATLYNTSSKSIAATLECASPKVLSATLDDKWLNTFDVWIGNVWGSAKGIDENDEEYAERVWRPILGDRTGGNAAVLFTSGALAVSDDYEFTIVKTPVFDDSRSNSHWRLTLAKSEADLKSTGLYVPSTQRQGSAGDMLTFIGIEMPYIYVVEAEERLDDYKTDHLDKVKDIKPTWVVQTDRVRLNNEGKEDALIRQLHPGDTLRLADKRFIEGDYETLYLSSLTITYREPTSDDAALNPDVEIVLSDSYSTSANPVATLQGEVSALARQVGAISNVQQIVRAVGDKLYLRKDGMSDRSMSPTQFASLVTSLGFRSGIAGGYGWGFFKDVNGNWVLEVDRLNVRQDMQVNSLVINQIIARGGMIVESAASMEITRVEDEGESYYKCYFDQKEGTVANLFHVDDVVWCNRFTPKNTDLKSYKRRVVEVEEDYVALTKGYEEIELDDETIDTGVNGDGIPEEGDIIVHYGNYTDKQRQYVKVRDVIGGGYERYIEGLNSVNAEGKEYYFVGRQAGMYNNRPRWFIGDDNGYVEWVNGVLNIKGRIVSTSSIGDKTIDQYIADAAQTAAAPNLMSEYSTDAINWHPVYTAADMWMRTSNDGGETWGPAIRFVGSDGAPGADGQYRKWQWAKNNSTTTAPTSGWQDTPLTALAGEYVWMRSGIVVPPATEPTVWEAATRLTGDKGASGDSVYQLDLTDEVKGIACDADGNPISSTIPTSQATVWKGATKVTSGITYSIAQTAGVSATVTAAGLITPSNLTADNATIVVQAEIGGITLQASISIYKVRPGENGEPAIVYSIEPEYDNITVSLDGTLSVSNLRVWIYKTTGDSARQVTNEKILKYQRIGEDVAQQTAPITNAADGALIPITADTTSIILTLFDTNGTTILDRERVPLVTDGKEIADEWAKVDERLAQMLRDLNGIDYLRKALRDGATVTEGGLLLSSLIKLGLWDKTDEANPMLTDVYAGMNGIIPYNKANLSAAEKLANDRTIASWWGGDMVDRFDAQNHPVAPAPSSAAAALVRMDGSAYFAGGNVGFNPDGSGWLAGNHITWDQYGSITFGTGIKINLGGGESSTLGDLNSAIKLMSTSVASITTFINNFANHFYPMVMDNNGNLERKTWGEITADMTVNAIGSEVNFFSDGWLSAKGIGSGTGGSGSSYGLLKKWTDYTAALADTDALSAGLGYSLYQSQLSLAARVSSLESGGGNYVTLNTAQTITANKTFTFETRFASSGTYTDPWNGVECAIKASGKIVASDSIKALSFIKDGGTSSQFLKADGSVDETEYMGFKRENIDPNTFFSIGVREVNNSTNAPTINGWHQYMSWGTGDGGYAFQFAHAYTYDSSLYFRHKHQNNWSAWHTVLDSFNYTGILNNKYVTLDTVQTISGAKTFQAILTTFTQEVRINGSSTNYASFPELMLHIPNLNWAKFKMDSEGMVYLLSGGDTGWSSFKPLKAASFVKSGGTSSQFLKADGSVDERIFVVARPDDSNVTMNAVAAYGNSMGMVRLTGTDQTINPNGQTEWHHFINLSFRTEPTNMWQTQIAVKAGSTDLWVRSRSGGSVVDGTAWVAPWTRILTGSNYTTVLNNSYVKKSGDSMTGNLTINAANANLQFGNFASWGGLNYPTIKSSSSDQWVMMINPHVAHANMNSLNASVIRMACDATATNWWDIKAGNGDNSFAVYRGNSSNKTIAGFKVTDTAMYLNGNTLWHSGNDGSGSGLDADMLDGVHNGEVTAKYLVNAVSISDLNAPSFVTNTIMVNSFLKDAQNRPGTGNNANLVLTLNNAMHGTSGYYAWQLAFQNSLGMYFRDWSAGVPNAWHKVAFTDSNVASATKLATARSIWGQNFDGSGNVSGNLTLGSNNSIIGGNSVEILKDHGNSHVTVNASNGDLYLGYWHTNNVRFFSGNTSGTGTEKMILLANGNVGIGTTSPAYKLDVNGEVRVRGGTHISGSGIGFNRNVSNGNIFDATKNGGQINFSAIYNGIEFGTVIGSSKSYSVQMILKADTGDLGIGTTSPSYKLHVNGTAYATKGQFGTATNSYALNAASFICDSWVRTTGDTGWYNQTYGGGWYMIDTTWMRTYNQKAIYTGAGEIRSDNCFIRDGWAGTSWNNGKGALNAVITDNNNQTPLLLACRGSNENATGANRLYAMELLNSGTDLRHYMGGNCVMAITNGGNVGINNTSPARALDVVGNERIASSISGAGGDVYLELWRGTNASWRMLNTGGYLKLQSNYTTSAGNYFDCLTMDYNTGHTWLKGRLGIGITPSFSLHVSGSAKFNSTVYAPTVRGEYGSIRLGDWDNNYYVILDSDMATEAFINTGTAGWCLTKDGGLTLFDTLTIKNAILSYDSSNTAIKCNKGFYSESYVSAKGSSSTSDMRLKRTLHNIAINVEDIAKAPAIIFAWRDGSGMDLGSSAQYWEHIIPEAVKWYSGYRSLAYDKLGLVTSIINSKEILHLRTRYNRWLGTHETRLQKLERENKELKQEVAELRAQLTVK